MMELVSGEVIVRVEAAHCKNGPDGPPVLGSIRFFLSSGRSSHWFAPTILPCETVQVFEGSVENPIVGLGRASEGFCPPVEHVTLKDGSESRGTARDLAIFRTAATLLSEVICSFSLALSSAVPRFVAIMRRCHPSARSSVTDRMLQNGVDAGAWMHCTHTCVPARLLSTFLLTR